MSTLVSILLAAVLNVLSVEVQPAIQAEASKMEIMNCQDSVNELNPHYIITEDELLSSKK